MEKTKEQLLKETVDRFKFLTEYNFQPKGFGFIETPGNSEEIKEKIVIKEDIKSSEDKETISDYLRGYNDGKSGKPLNESKEVKIEVKKEDVKPEN